MVRGRTPDGLTARTEFVSARFRPSTVAILDKLRKETPRSRFLEHLINEEDKRQTKEPK